VPTILTREGFSIMIYNDDHLPMQVHVFKAEGEAIINLGDATTPPWVRGNINMKGRTERRALEIVGENQDKLIQEWRRRNG